MTIKNLFPISRPTLDLNFAKTKRLDGRITFTRSSTGTYSDANGVLQSAATNTARFDHNPATGESLGLLVEESRTNYAFYGEQFDNSVWSRVNVTVTPNGIIAPNGTITADTLAFTAGGSYVYQQLTTPTISAGQTLTYSVWVWSSSKAVIGVRVADTATGTMSGFQSVSLTGVAQRVSVVVTAASNTTQWSIGLDNRVGLGGDQVAGSVNVWGAQLEAGSFPTSYIPTPATFTSRASSATYYDANGVIQTAGINVARSAAFFPDSNGTMRSAGLLLEAASTNLVTYSEQFDNAAWSKNAATISANATTAPDGTTTADKLASNNQVERFCVYRYLTMTADKVQTFSCYGKASEWNFMTLVIGKQGAPYTRDSYTINLSSGAVNKGPWTTSNVLFTSFATQRLANGWWRLSISVKVDASSTDLHLEIGTSPTNQYNNGMSGNGTSGIFIWGAQWEQDASYPTSYIPTTTATVTRSADVSSSATVTRSADVVSITGTNFSSWFAQNGQFTILSEFVGLRNGTYNDTYSELFRFSSGIGVQRRSATTMNWQKPGFDWVVISGMNNLSSATVKTKLCSAVNNNVYTLAVPGNVVSGTHDVFPTQSSIIFGAINVGGVYACTTLSRLTYWPTRLSDAQLQSLTL